MKFLSALAILSVCFLSTEAYYHDLTLATFNFGSPAVKGKLTGLVKGPTEAMEIEFNEDIYYKYKKVGAKFEFPEAISEIKLKFEATEDKNAKFTVGPMIAAILDNSEAHVFKPSFNYISENNDVVYSKVAGL